MAAGRPRTFDTERALEDALDVFWRNGYRGTTTRDLEDRLGVRQASLYAAFGSKADLAGLAMDRYVARLDEHLLVPLRETADGLHAIREFLASLAEWLAADDVRGCMLGRIMSEGPADPALAERLADHRRRLGTALAGALRRAADSGAVDPATVAARAGLLRSAILGLNMAVTVGADADEIRAMAHAVREEIGRWR